MGTAGGLPSNRTVLVGLSLKRVLHMPPAAIMAVGAGMSMMGSMKAGEAAEEQGQQEMAYLYAQAEQEKVAQLRDLTDFDRESSRAQARARAVAAAQGGGTEGALDLFQYQASVFGENRQRLINDSDARIAGLNTRAKSAFNAGQEAKWSIIQQGAGKAASMFAGGMGGMGGGGAAPAGGFSSVGSLISARGIR